MNAWRCAVLALAAGLVQVSAGYADVPPGAPVSPLAPTDEDCQRLDQQLWALQQAAHDRQLECLRQPARFGPGEECSLLPPYRVREVALVAYAQCSPIAVDLCQIKAHRDREVTTCRNRVRTRAPDADGAQRNRDGGPEDARARRLRQLNDDLEQAITAWDDLQSLLNDPREFLVSKAQEVLWRGIFPEGLTPTADDRPDLAAEVYRYSFTFANEVVDRTPNPQLIKAFQRESLDRLAVEVGRTLERQRLLERQIGTFSVELAQVSAAPIGFAPVGNPRPSAGQGTDCSVLEDPEASRRLLQQDEMAWLELEARCP